MIIVDFFVLDIQKSLSHHDQHPGHDSDWEVVNAPHPSHDHSADKNSKTQQGNAAHVAHPTPSHKGKKVS